MNKMDRIAAVWEAIGKLTYAEMIEVAAHLRDAGVTIGVGICNDATEVAKMLESAREAYMERDDD